jgi:hypothetical protein
MFSYLKAEMSDVIQGSCWLVLGCVSDIVVPLYIGWVISAVSALKFE